MCIGYLLPGIPVEVVSFSVSVVLSKKAITGLYPPIFQLSECSCWWYQRTLGFGFPGRPQLSCACSPAIPALLQSFSPDPCVVLAAHSYSWGLGAQISCFDIFKVIQESQESTPIPGVLYRAVVSR